MDKKKKHIRPKKCEKQLFIRPKKCEKYYLTRSGTRRCTNLVILTHFLNTDYMFNVVRQVHMPPTITTLQPLSKFGSLFHNSILPFYIKIGQCKLYVKKKCVFPLHNSKKPLIFVVLKQYLNCKVVAKKITIGRKLTLPQLIEIYNKKANS